MNYIEARKYHVSPFAREYRRYTHVSAIAFVRKLLPQANLHRQTV